MRTPFSPNPGQTVNIAATPATANVALPTRSTSGEESIMVSNQGTGTVFFALGTSSSVTASATADTPVLAGQQRVFVLPQGFTYVAAIMPSTNATVYFSVGRGGI